MYWTHSCHQGRAMTNVSGGGGGGLIGCLIYRETVRYPQWTDVGNETGSPHIHSINSPTSVCHDKLCM